MTKKGGKFCLLLAFSSDKPQFCRKRKVMKKLVFESVCGRVMHYLQSNDQIPDFSVICMLSGCRSAAVDNVFWECFGMSGEDVIGVIYAER